MNHIEAMKQMVEAVEADLKLFNIPYTARMLEALAALRTAIEQAMKQALEAWKHDCAALLQNDVELWVDRCPHCGKPRTTPPAAHVQEPVANANAVASGSVGHPAYTPQDHWEAWANKPPAAPVQELPDDGFTQALIERDEYHAIADELAEMIAQITGEDIGEHTSANFPWRNALDAAENWLCHPPAAQRQWVGLTEDEQDELVYGVYDLRTRMELAIGIEAKLREKNGGQ